MYVCMYLSYQFFLRLASLFKQQTFFEPTKKQKSLILRAKLVQQHIWNEFKQNATQISTAVKRMRRFFHGLYFRGILFTIKQNTWTMT